jgi:hypothetical protein
MQPDLHREGYSVFVLCCDLSPDTPAGEFVSIIDILDGVFAQIGVAKEDFFPSPYDVRAANAGLHDGIKALVDDPGEATEFLAYRFRFLPLLSKLSFATSPCGRLEANAAESSGFDNHEIGGLRKQAPGP